MTAVADPSVVVYAFVERSHSAAARAFLAEAPTLIAPTLFLAETSNTLAKYVRLGELAAERAAGSFETARALVPVLVPDEELIDEAFALALALSHSVYDCLYLALAKRRGCLFVTADERFVRKLAETAHAGSIVSLASWRP